MADTLPYLLLALGFLPVITVVRANLLYAIRTREFVVLLRVPILKGDLNRVLKVCSTFEAPLARATNLMIMKIKRPWALDLAFHEGLAELTHLNKAYVARLHGAALVIFAVLLVATFHPAAPRWTVAVVVVLAVGVEMGWVAVTRNIREQIVALYSIRTLLYSNTSKMCDLGTGTEYVPVRYRPVAMSGAELRAYRERMDGFVENVQRLKEAGVTVDTTAEWEKVEKEHFQPTVEEPL